MFATDNIEFIRIQLQIDDKLKSLQFKNLVIEFDNENFKIHNHQLVIHTSSIFKYYVVFQTECGKVNVAYYDKVSELLIFMDLEFKKFGSKWCKMTIVNCRQD
jgi:hypothetical protein